MKAASFTVASAQYAEDLRRRLTSETGNLRRAGCEVSLQESRAGDYTFFHLQGQDTGGRVRQSLSRAVADLIFRCWQDWILERTVRANYRYLEPGERELILARARRALSGKGREVLVEAMRRGKVLQVLQDYFDCNTSLVVDGFVTFRLKDYVEELEDAVDRAVDEFMMDREYTEFIRLLRHFLEAQKPRLDLVHAIVRGDGSFRLVDAKQNVVTDEYLEQCISVTGEGVPDQDDLLISALITIAPQRLHVHCSAGCESDGVETISRVFAGRTIVCHGCPICLDPSIDASKHH